MAGIFWDHEIVCVKKPGLRCHNEETDGGLQAKKTAGTAM